MNTFAKHAERTGVVGYGAMGAEIARHLVLAGNDVCVYDRDEGKGRAAASASFTVVDSIEELAANCDVALILVGDEVTVAAMIADDGPFNLPGSITDYVCVLSTVDPALFAGRSALADSGRLVDAPVCRALEGARDATLLALLACSDSAASALRPRLAPFCSDVSHVSERLGDAQVLKTVNNIMLWGAFMATEEAFGLARHQGLEPERLIEMFSTSSADSWALRHWNQASELAWSKKDMAIATKLADRTNLAAPLTRLVGGLVRTSDHLGHAT